MDADDMLPPGALARATALLEARPEVGSRLDRPLCAHGCNVVSNPEVVMRTEVMQDCGGFNRDLPHSGDFGLWLQMAARADVGRVNGPAQGYYRVHDKSMQRTVYKGVLVDLRQRRDTFEYVFAGPAKAFPDSDELHSTARRVLAAQALDRACHGYDRGHPLTGNHDIEALVAFALEVWPEAAQLSGGGRSSVAGASAPRRRRACSWRAPSCAGP